jgi:hypothetical protein
MKSLVRQDIADSAYFARYDEAVFFLMKLDEGVRSALAP